jgi:hypothetical protein
LKELLRSNDLVFLSWIRSILDDENIALFVMDGQMSVLEGSANAIPRRVMVDEEDHAKAVRLLKDAQSNVDGLVLFDEE